MSDIRSLGSNYQRCSQSRKMSIGIAVDSSAKKSDITGNRYNPKGQKGSPWIAPKPLMRSRTLSESVNTPTKVANGACSNLGGVKELTAGTSSQSGNVKPKKVDIVAPGKENIKGVTTERGKGSTQEAVAEISVPNEGVKQQKLVESRGKETLKMKLWEALTTVPPATRELEGSRSDGVDDHVMKQKDGNKEDASLKRWVNSETIETDSENPVVAVSRRATRSLSRKRGPAVASPKRSRKKLFPAKEEWKVFTFEEKCNRTPETVSGEHKDMTTEDGHLEKQMPCQSKQVKVLPRFNSRELSPPLSFPMDAIFSGEHKDMTPEAGHLEKQMPCQSKQVKVPPRFNSRELSPLCFPKAVPTVEGSGDETDASLDIHPAEKNISSPGRHDTHEKVNYNDSTVEGSGDETDTSLEVRPGEKHISSPGRHDIHEKVNYNDPTVEGSRDEIGTSLDVCPADKHISSPDCCDIREEVNYDNQSPFCSPNVFGENMDTTPEAGHFEKQMPCQSKQVKVRKFNYRFCFANEVPTVEGSGNESRETNLSVDVRPAEKHISSPGHHDIHKEVNYNDLSPFCSLNVTRLTEASQEYEDGLDRAVALFGSSLEEFKNKLVSSTKKRRAEILDSTAEEIHSEFQSAKSLIEKDVTKLASASRTKRQILEKNFDEKQKQLWLIQDKLRDEIHRHLQEFTRTVERLQAHETELKGVIERRKASHQKLLLQVDKAVENHLSDAQRRLISIQKAGRSKMQTLKNAIAECLEGGIFT